MMRHVAGYFSQLVASFGRGWNDFWFTPSDPSAVSLIRLLTGLVAIYWHATLLADLEAFFGPQGLLPVADVAPLDANLASYMNFITAPLELWIVHLVGLAVLVLFAAGLWTRVTTILALVVFLSVVNRAPMITGRAEVVMAMLMLYLCVAPCGRRFSLDAWLASRKGAAYDGRKPATGATVATRLIQVHLAMLIATMGLSQLSSGIWWDGWGLWFLITRQESRLVDFTWLEASPLAVDFWTHLVVVFELAFPVLIWVPLARPLLLALGLVVWTSLALVTGDILFAMMMCIASLAFVSPGLLSALPLRATSSD